MLLDEETRRNAGLIALLFALLFGALIAFGLRAPDARPTAIYPESVLAMDEASVTIGVGDELAADPSADEAYGTPADGGDDEDWDDEDWDDVVTGRYQGDGAAAESKRERRARRAKRKRRRARRGDADGSERADRGADEAGDDGDDGDDDDDTGDAASDSDDGEPNAGRRRSRGKRDLDAASDAAMALVDGAIRDEAAARRERVKRKVDIAGEKADPVAAYRQAIQRTVRKNLSGVRWCWQGVVQRNPGIRAKVDLVFSIDSGGRLNDAVVDTHDLRDAAFDQCVTRKMSRWRFPAPDHTDDDVRVRYPVSLKTR